MAAAPPRERKKPGPARRFDAQVNFMLSPEQRGELERLAEEEQTSVSAIVRQAVQRLLMERQMRT